MIDEGLKAAVLSRYASFYPSWTDVTVTETTKSSFSGWFAVVVGKLGDGTPNEEVCFVESDYRVRIFPTTLDLVRFLEEKANSSLLERVFNRSVLTGAVFLLLIVAVFVSGFVGGYKPEALAILGSVVGSAGGFFFASERMKSDGKNSN